jgi:hypothetical protein
MYFFRTLTSLTLVAAALFLTYCTSPTKSKKKTEQSVVFEDIWYSDEVDNNENGYYSSITLNFTVRLTSGTLQAHIVMGLFSETLGEDTPVGGGFWEMVTLTESSQDFNITISGYETDDYWMQLWVIDTEDEEQIYATRTPNTNSELGNFKLELPQQDSGFYIRFNNYTFTQIELNVEGSDYTLPIESTIKIELDGNPGSVGWEGLTYGKTGDTQQQIGNILTWDYREDNTVGLDSLVWDLTIHPDWFFLYMYNNSGYNWSPIDINVGKDASYYFKEYIRIPEGQDKWFTTGYYRQFSDTQVDAYYEDYPTWAPITWTNVEFEPFWPDKYANSSFIAALSYGSSAKISTEDILSKAVPIGGIKALLRSNSNISRMDGSSGIAVPNSGAR